MFGTSEIIVVLLVVLILFGSARFPKIMENFALGLKTFKKSMSGDNVEKVGTKEKSQTTHKQTKAKKSVKGKK